MSLGCCRRALRAAVVAVVGGTFAALGASAHAHLMVAQKGTLNFSGDGAYLLLSLPVSALTQVDDDGDGLLSARELQAHTAHIEQQVRAGVQLRVSGRALELQGLLLNLSPPEHRPGRPLEHRPDAPASQLVVMGRFTSGGHALPVASAQLSFKLGLYGRAPTERRYDLVFTQREAKAARPSRSQTARFTPARSEQRLFADVATR